MSARDRLIYTTIELLRRHGVAGTGVAQILEDGGVSRRSIYLNFPDGKTGLVAEATRVAGSLIDSQIAAVAAQPTARDALSAFVAQWKSTLAESHFAAGCPIAAASLSRSSSPAVADLAGEAFDRWHATLSKALHRHGLDSPTSRTLATTVLSAIEGAVIMCIAAKSATALDDVETQLGILLNHHIETVRHDMHPHP